jgi:L-seryl-tRNA(Ser) seleniumtransferase
MPAKLSPNSISRYAALPSVDDVLRSETAARLINATGRKRLTEMSRRVVGELRDRLKNGHPQSSKEEMLALAEQTLETLWQQSRSTGIKRVINATGVVIHTNLGRAPLSDAAKKALVESAGYCNTEFDLTTGERGRRGERVETLVCELTGAEDAIVVNNCAAAAFFVLTAFAVGREVIISRGELVEIGGEFRIPDVLARAGVTLKEVGTTNRTRVSDYEQAINERTAMILKVHPSNYRIVGFTASPSLTELADIAKRKNVVLYEDAGSGALIDLTALGLGDEPVISESLAGGADIVTFSGDKLVGGPQAGIIAGKRDHIERLRKDPLYRALRVSKLIYAALETTFEAHLCGRGIEEVPVLRMLAADPKTLEKRCRRLIEKLADTSLKAEIVLGNSAVGGGAAPMTQPESPLIALTHPAFSAEKLETKLRKAEIPVITRIHNAHVTIDFRTVSEGEESDLLNALQSVISQ